ncbi:MAG: hypothetical protein IH588_19605 [Anaerolineales bacterium]|nr:hypothetical protein [Anaerolineales bacterium]
MLVPIHEEMTREALSPHFSERALEIIIAANRKQDSWGGLIGHDEFHYDKDVEKGDRYIIEQRGYVLATLMTQGVLSAWIAFGRLLHTAQDFYSHTNYVSLWIDQHNGAPPSPLEIDPVQKDILRSPSLHSGKIYLPMDALYFVPLLREFSLKLLPDDSHGKMNLDSPQQGANFAYARTAAVKRTRYEFDILRKLLTPEMFARFVDK